MDETRYRLREFLDRDYASLARTSHRLNPERYPSVSELRHWDEVRRRPPMVYRSFTVEAVGAGTGVAYGELFTELDTVDPNYLRLGVTVDPDHQRQGIGRYLARVLESEARALGATRLWAQARADRPRDLSFGLQQGFEERRRTWESTLELPAPGYAAVPRRAEGLAKEGIEFATLAEEGPGRPEVRTEVHRLFNAALADEPRMGPYTPSTLDQFVSFNLETPGFLPDAFFLARKGDRYVGVSNLELLAAEPGVLYQVFTGTLREFRGRGIATELKRRTVEYAQQHGFRAIRTGNDSLNAPMWAINEKIGYRRKVERVQFEKVVSRPPPL